MEPADGEIRKDDENTAPEEYAGIAGRLPRRSAQRLSWQEEIIGVHLDWNASMAARYPRFFGRGRPLRTAEDTPFATSSETYLRGELGSYSDETVRRYRDMVLRRKAAGENLVEQIARNQARRYGYASLEESEKSL